MRTSDDERFKPELRTRARRLYEEGRSLREVGHIMGISHERVRRLVKEGDGVLRRPGPKPKGQ